MATAVKNTRELLEALGRGQQVELPPDFQCDHEDGLSGLSLSLSEKMLGVEEVKRIGWALESTKAPIQYLNLYCM